MHRTSLIVALLVIVIGLVFWAGMEYGEWRALHGYVTAAPADGATASGAGW